MVLVYRPTDYTELGFRLIFGGINIGGKFDPDSHLRMTVVNRGSKVNSRNIFIDDYFSLPGKEICGAINGIQIFPRADKAI